MSEDNDDVIAEVKIDRTKAVIRLFAYFCLFVLFGTISPNIDFVKYGPGVGGKTSLFFLILICFIAQIVLVLSFIKGFIHLVRGNTIFYADGRRIKCKGFLFPQDGIAWGDLMMTETQFSTFPFFTRSYLVFHLKDSDKYKGAFGFLGDLNERRYGSFLVARIPDIATRNADEISKLCNDKIRSRDEVKRLEYLELGV